MSVTRHPFDAIWVRDGTGFAGHLPLLSAHDCDRELGILRTVVHHADAPTTLVAMLADPNWRPNIVAATAILFLPRDARFARELWGAVDQASWASPQLAVVLSLHDPDFVARAVERAWRHCSIAPGRWRETLDGKPNPKAISALVALLDGLAPDEARRLRDDPTVASLLGVPNEDGDRIALGWRERMLPQIQESRARD